MGLFKSYSEKEVKRVQPIVNKINSLEPEMEKLSDAELRAKTDNFKDVWDNKYQEFRKEDRTKSEECSKCCGERRKRGSLYLVFLRLHNHRMPKKCPKTAGEMTGKQGKIKQRFVRGAENEMGEN